MKAVDALGGMIAAPVRTLRTIARDGASPWPPVLLLVAAVVLAEAKVLQRLLFLLGDGGVVILHRIRDDVFVADLRTHAALLVGTCVVVAGLAFALAKGAVSPRNAAVAALWLLVPLCALMCVGVFLDGVGLPLWWMPHLPVDSMAVVVGRKVSWARFAVKCAVSYGIPLLLALSLVPWLRSRGDVPAVSTARTRAGLGAFFLAVALAATGAAVSSARYASRIRPVLPGDTLPDVVLHRIDEFGVSNDPFEPSSFVGKVLVIDFWASWCAPCRRSMPELSKIYDAHKAEGLVVFGLDREPENPKAARQALQEIKPSFPCALDNRGYGERLGLTSLPTSYIVDKHGVVRHLHLGYTEPGVVESEIEELLAE